MADNLPSFRSLVNILEGKETITLDPLPYKIDDLEPVLPKEIVSYHYSFLSQGYVDRYNKGISPDFNFAGAALHNKYWAGFQKYKAGNKPFGSVLSLVERIYGSYDKFVDEFVEIGSTLEGSGWVILTKLGEIKLIHNHKLRSDIVINIDLWEHSIFEFGKNKKKYMRDCFKILDWAIINARL
jgi:Fe-Mn family superoxide dismutase